MCKSVLSNLPTYYMFLFLMPKELIPILERIMRKFFREGYKGCKINHLVKWNLVIKPSVLGALKPKIWHFWPKGDGDTSMKKTPHGVR